MRLTSILTSWILCGISITITSITYQNWEYRDNLYTPTRHVVELPSVQGHSNVLLWCDH